jgi:hypothetical protein
LGGVVVQVQKGHASAGVQTDRRRAKVHFGARTVVSPKHVAGRYGPVHKGLNPVRFTSRLEGN